MKMIFNIASREFRTLFLSPLAWSILGVVQVILAFLFLTQINSFVSIQPQLANIEGAPGLTDLVITPLYTSTGILLLLITPLLTMRLISEERRNKTLSLLLSAPVTNSEIIFGKYLGVFGLLLLMVLMVSVMPLSLLAGGELDFGKFAANILALILLLTSFTAVGLFTSCLANHPTVAAISAFGVLLLLWLLGWATGLNAERSEILDYFSMLNHFQKLQSGLIDSKDICFYLLFTATFLILSIRQLENDRLQK